MNWTTRNPARFLISIAVGLLVGIVALQYSAGYFLVLIVGVGAGIALHAYLKRQA